MTARWMSEALWVDLMTSRIKRNVDNEGVSPCSANEHDDWDYHAWIRGEHERDKDQSGPVVIHAQPIHECDTFLF
jgi:hypothetical protein